MRILVKLQSNRPVEAEQKQCKKSKYLGLNIIWPAVPKRLCNVHPCFHAKLGLFTVFVLTLLYKLVLWHVSVFDFLQMTFPLKQFAHPLTMTCLAYKTMFWQCSTT